MKKPCEGKNINKRQIQSQNRSEDGEKKNLVRYGAVYEKLFIISPWQVIQEQQLGWAASICRRPGDFERDRLKGVDVMTRLAST